MSIGIILSIIRFSFLISSLKNESYLSEDRHNIEMVRIVDLFLPFFVFDQSKYYNDLFHLSCSPRVNFLLAGLLTLLSILMLLLDVVSGSSGSVGGG